MLGPSVALRAQPGDRQPVLGRVAGVVVGVELAHDGRRPALLAAAGRRQRPAADGLPDGVMGLAL
jgi:hypothetical protein